MQFLIRKACLPRKGSTKFVLTSDIAQQFIINLLIMDQHIDFTNFTVPSFNANTFQNIFQNFGQQNPISYQNYQPKMMTHQELISVLVQICNMLDEKLNFELRKNQFLLERLYSMNYVEPIPEPLVKQEHVQQVEEEEDVVKFEHKEQLKIQTTFKEKKLAVNDTKNISKNFGKAVITFIQKNPQKVRRILQSHNIDLTLFSNELKEKKKNLISIKQLRSLWLQSEFEYAKPFREISYLFLRKASFKYIFGSRIADYAGHLKYRKRMIEALHSPKQFTSIKQ